MKTKICFVIILPLIMSFSSIAQTQKGSFVLSGKTGLNFLFSKVTTGTDSIQTGKSKSNEYDFTLGAGYFFADNICVALSGIYSYKYYKILQGYLNAGTQNITHSLTIVPEVQYYLPVQGKLKPSVALGAGYTWLQQRDSRITENYNKVYDLSGIAFYGGLGVSYFITSSISFDLSAQYSYTKLKDKLNPNEFQKQNQLAGTMGISVFF